MNGRAAESDVVKFLRAALADGAHAVTRLEASARAAGLLNERQRITHTRAFRQAKKSLRIRSLRAGFGSRSHWLWELPREDERSARAERKAAPLRRIPSDWIEGIARLNADRPPSDVPRHRWRQFVNDCTHFLSPSEGWAERAARLGWRSWCEHGKRAAGPANRSKKRAGAARHCYPLGPAFWQCCGAAAFRSHPSRRPGDTGTGRRRAWAKHGPVPPSGAVTRAEKIATGIATGLRTMRHDQG